jgi:formylglycine-generating enzyme required for sulfatase activity
MRRAAPAIAWTTLALAGGCEQPRTELVVRVDSEVAWGAGQAVQAVVLTVRRSSATGPLRSTRTMALGTGGERRSLPLHVGVLPGDDTDTPIWIEALGCGDPNGCTPSTAVVAQRAVVRFTRGQTEEVTLLLASACVGVSCASDERCGAGGRCEPATRSMVRPFDGTDAATVADVVMDTGRVDVGVSTDGGMDAVGVDAATFDLPALDIAPTVDVPAVDTAASCGALELRCVGVCVAALRDPANCGACGEACPAVAGATPTCMGGRCGYACDAAHADCDERPSNGCEQDIVSDVANCGACGRACSLANGTAACVAGACAVTTCVVGYANCDGNAANGCETDTRRSVVHCGTCGVACASGQRCQERSCMAVTCPTDAPRIPAGTFPMGSTENAAEMPVHSVTLSAFCMGATEVTTAAYRTCIAGGGCTAPALGGSCDDVISNWHRVDRENHPMNCLTWEQASDYCAWRGGRLPTEAEWEYAARGTDGRRFPWGNTEPSPADVPARLCWAHQLPETTCPVRAFAVDASPFGMFDMAGNLFEWTADWHGPYAAGPVTNPTGPTTGTHRARRGGVWTLSSGPDVRLSRRYPYLPTAGDFSVGVRCAWDAQ